VSGLSVATVAGSATCQQRTFRYLEQLRFAAFPAGLTSARGGPAFGLRCGQPRLASRNESLVARMTVPRHNICGALFPVHHFRWPRAATVFQYIESFVHLIN